MTLEQRLVGLAQAIAADIVALQASDKWPMVCDTIDIAEQVTVNVNHQLIVAENINNSGTIVNNGKVFII